MKQAKVYLGILLALLVFEVVHGIWQASLRDCVVLIGKGAKLACGSARWPAAIVQAVFFLTVMPLFVVWLVKRINRRGQK